MGTIALIGCEQVGPLNDDSPTVSSDETTPNRFDERLTELAENLPSAEIKKEPYEVLETFYDNGQVNTRTSFVDGQREGPLERFDRNGQLRQRADYFDGKRHGMYESYYANGNSSLKARYVDGRMQGIAEIFDERGMLRGKGHYLAGTLDKETIECWDSNGNLRLPAFLYSKLHSICLLTVYQ